MFPQRAWIWTDKVTLVAFVRIFPLCVFRCVFKLPVPTDAKSHWLHLFDFSTLCVSSKSLDLKRQSHIGCICLNFSTVHFQMCPQIACPNKFKFRSVALVWLFYTVRLQMFPQRAFRSEKAKSHWLHFLHCAISYVSSNCLPEQMQSHNGCIFFTFLYCSLSNVSSKSLDLNRQSDLAGICLIFSTVRFLMCPKIACPNKSHR